ncbi:disulfide bond formation protein B [Polymorphum gilvum]|uniref:Putative DsbB-like disulfide oxidoreductase n=1 Tax=Polymorphum gilvum (strain LMG 25793 / CGMCC 1.9160 / SL003B-26A1) TaxID=991905 RepID=F2J2Z8_POLGS|nr:disulfide bond formation protein B [Polymorphum gilvum]ADZ68868.1 Putative DsbB-like disulfide oxidoreductase [Polymorphum gilvum SL003B-26A1]
MTMTDAAKAKLATLVVLLGGLAVIATAWGFQLIGGYLPCKLCLEQRIPYYAGLPLVLIALLVPSRPWLRAVLLLAVAAVFVYGAGLGTYQAGAEWGFWAGPTDCGGGGAGPASAADMLSALKATRVVSCTEASWRMFGLSFAGWNVVASVGLALVALIGAYFSRKS